jgi:hypothetical protein
MATKKKQEPIEFEVDSDVLHATAMDHAQKIRAGLTEMIEAGGMGFPAEMLEGIRHAADEHIQRMEEAHKQMPRTVGRFRVRR